MLALLPNRNRTMTCYPTFRLTTPATFCLSNLFTVSTSLPSIASTWINGTHYVQSSRT